VWRPGGLGDTLVALPALEGLRQAGLGPVRVAASTPWAPLLLAAGVDQVEDAGSGSLSSLFINPLLPSPGLLASARAVVWSESTAFRHNLEKWAERSGREVLCGPAFPAGRRRMGAALVASLSPWGVRAALPRWRLPRHQPHLRRLLLAPGAGSPSKCWSGAGFGALAGLARAAGWEPLYVHGPADA
jgi:hypothetical protein